MVALRRKRLIVNGDDFGLSDQVNAAILHAHQHGILTNTSLMVSAQAWRGAVELAKATPSLQVGLHLTLVQGRSVLSPHHLSQLTDRSGNFLHNPTRAGLRYFFSPRARSQVGDECRAQIERFLATGLPLTHIDGHVNMHLHPVVLNSLLDLAKEYGVRAMRLTREDLACSLALDPRAALRKRWESFIFTRLARRAERSCARPALSGRMRCSVCTRPERWMSPTCWGSCPACKLASPNCTATPPFCPAPRSSAGHRAIDATPNWPP